MADDYSTESADKQWSMHINTARRFCKYDFIWYVSATWGYYVQNIQLYIVIPVEDRETFLKCYYPFDYKNSPAYEIICIIQIILAIPIAAANAMTESLLISLVSKNIQNTRRIIIQNQFYLCLKMFPIRNVDSSAGHKLRFKWSFFCF